MDLNPKGCWFESNWRSSEPCQGRAPRSKTRKRRDNESDVRAPRSLSVLRRAAAILALAVAVIAGTAATTAADSHPVDATTSAFTPAAADRAALTALIAMYDQPTGLWPVGHLTGWWSSANNMTALIDAERALGVHTYDGLIARTYTLNIERGADYSGIGFRNHYYDDSLWWGLAWLDAYRWTGDRRYLAVAEADDAYAHDARVTSACGAAIPWAMELIKNGGQENAITNGLGMELSAQLAVTTGRATYRHEALADWVWLQQSGLIGTDGLVRDHLDAHCRPTGPAWSYNQGTMAAGLTALAAASGQAGYLATARQLADAATTSGRLNPGGVLTDPCEGSGTCVVDGATFKGAAVRGLAALNRALPDHPYTAYLLRQATTMYGHDRMTGDLYGQHWAGPPDTDNSARQGTAVDLLTAVA